LVDILVYSVYNKHMNTATLAKHLALILTLSGALATSLSIDPLNIWNY